MTTFTLPQQLVLLACARGSRQRATMQDFIEGYRVTRTATNVWTEDGVVTTYTVGAHRLDSSSWNHLRTRLRDFGFIVREELLSLWIYTILITPDPAVWDPTPPEEDEDEDERPSEEECALEIEDGVSYWVTWIDGSRIRMKARSRHDTSGHIDLQHVGLGAVLWRANHPECRQGYSLEKVEEAPCKP